MCIQFLINLVKFKIYQINVIIWFYNKNNYKLINFILNNSKTDQIILKLMKKKNKVIIYTNYYLMENLKLIKVKLIINYIN